MLGAVRMQWFESNELSILNSINFLGAAVTGALGLAITAPIMRLVGWQDTLLIYGGACGVVALLAVLCMRDPLLSLSTGTDDSATCDKFELEDILKRKETWLLALAFSAPVAISVVMPPSLPAYYVQTKGITITTASGLVSTVYLFGIPAAIAGGLLGVKAGVRKPFLIANGLMLGCGMLGGSLFRRVSSAIVLGLDWDRLVILYRNILHHTHGVRRNDTSCRGHDDWCYYIRRNAIWFYSALGCRLAGGCNGHVENRTDCLWLFWVSNGDLPGLSQGDWAGSQNGLMIYHVEVNDTRKFFQA